jgi:Flp pilus assembly protein TadG
MAIMLSAISRHAGNAKRTLERLCDDQRGAGVVALGIALPVLAGIAGIGVEVGLWYTQKRDLQVAADASAVAGAFELARSNEAHINTAAIAQAAKNGVTAGSDTTIVVTPSTSGATGSVVVQVTKQVPRLFSAIFMEGAVNIAARATASVEITGDACALALDETVSQALLIQGSSSVTMPTCTLAANSRHASAVSISGSASLTAESLWSAGGINTGGSAAITLPGGQLDHMWSVADPYAALTIPSFGACDFHNKTYSNIATTIGPAVYCGGLTFGANSQVTLEPGTYYIVNGDLTMNAQSVVRCNCSGQQGVTFVLTTSGAVSQIGRVVINGGADVQLTAPSDPNDAFVGVLIYQDRRATSTAVNKLNGGSTMTLTGAIYTPAQAAEWSGNNGSASSNCTRIIAKTVSFIGNSELNNSGCEAMGVKPIEVTRVRVTA